MKNLYLTVFDKEKGVGQSIDMIYDENGNFNKYVLTDLDEEDFYGTDNTEVQKWRIK